MLLACRSQLFKPAPTAQPHCCCSDAVHPKHRPPASLMGVMHNDGIIINSPCIRTKRRADLQPGTCCPLVRLTWGLSPSCQLARPPHVPTCSPHTCRRTPLETTVNHGQPRSTDKQTNERTQTNRLADQPCMHHPFLKNPTPKCPKQQPLLPHPPPS